MHLENLTRNARHNNLIKLLETCCITAVLGGVALKSEPLIHEPFDLPVGANLYEQQAGAGINGKWIEHQQESGHPQESGFSIVKGSLALNSELISGSRAFKSMERSLRTSCDIGATLSTSGLLQNGSSLWFSFLWQHRNDRFVSGKTSFAIGTAPISDTPHPAMAENGTGIGASIKSMRDISACTWNNGAMRKSEALKGAWEAKKTVLIVGRATWSVDPTGKDQVDIFLPGEDLKLNEAVSSTTAVIDQSKLNTLAIGSTSDGFINIDEIRIGATYNDVIPNGIKINNNLASSSNKPSISTSDNSGNASNNKDGSHSNTINIPPKNNLSQLPDGETILLADNFESETENWEYSGASSPYNHVEGENHARTGYAAAMLASKDNKPGYITLKRPFAVKSKGARELYLTFDYKWHQSGSQTSKFEVESSTDDGKTWKTMSSGYTSDEQKGSVFLKVVDGLTDETLFRFKKDASSSEDNYRVYIDNVTISAKR